MKKRNGPWTADVVVPGERIKKKKKKRETHAEECRFIRRDSFFFFPLSWLLLVNVTEQRKYQHKHIGEYLEK